mgnify:CR=1 FL=1
MANKTSMVQKVSRFFRSYTSELLAGFFVGCVAVWVLGPTPVLADVAASPQNTKIVRERLPIAETAHPRAILKMEVSAYTSRPEETDSTPFTTASGTRVHDGTLATNRLKFGTKVRIPDLYCDKIFTVEDRMNERYQNHADIWVDDLVVARQIGRRHLTVEVF